MPLNDINIYGINDIAFDFFKKTGTPTLAGGPGSGTNNRALM
jgi:hypothetical protein